MINGQLQAVKHLIDEPIEVVHEDTKTTGGQKGVFF